MISLFKQSGQQGQAEGSANAESRISEHGFGAMRAEPDYVDRDYKDPKYIDNLRAQIDRERHPRNMLVELH